MIILICLTHFFAIPWNTFCILHNYYLENLINLPTVENYLDVDFAYYILTLHILRVVHYQLEP